jgi:predicted nucleic acid-binding protein
MTYLVDANVLSEPTKPSPDANVVVWLEVHDQDVVVDPIVLGELESGILSLPVGRKRARLEVWFAALVRSVDCLPWTLAVGRRWARVVAEANRKGRPLPVLDSMMAATALHYKLTVATRNVRHFQQAGVKVVDPFA